MYAEIFICWLVVAVSDFFAARQQENMIIINTAPHAARMAPVADAGLDEVPDEVL